MTSAVRTSSCMCGAVELRLEGEPAVMAYCHCESCRLWFGAPVHGSSLWPAARVAITKGEDRVAVYKKTPATGSIRKFCTSCGVPELVDHPSAGMTDVPAVSVRGLAFEPALHTHYGERVISMRDGLPKYRDFDPAVGGTGEILPE